MGSPLARGRLEAIGPIGKRSALVVSIQCVINREALEDKKLGNKEENYQPADVISDVIKMVNAILNSPQKSREFDELVIETESDGHLYHSEVWWISCERVMEIVWNLR